MERQIAKNYLLSADVIRVLAILGVVVVHTANAVYGRPDFFGGISWWFAILLNSMSRIAIPLFIMLSGYFLLNKNESYKATLKRTFSRIIIPLLFWFIADTIWDGGLISFSGINFSLIQRLLTVNVFDLYFLIILAGLYAISPLLRNFLSISSYSVQKIFTIGALLFGVVIFAAEYLFYLCSPASSFTYWIPYTGLFVAGYFLGNNAKNFKNRSLLLAYGIALSATIFLSYLYYSLHNSGNEILASHGCLSFYSDSYLSLNVVIMSLCAFVLLFKLNLQPLNNFTKRAIYSIARNSFGIYVLHTFFLDILDSKFHFFDPISPAWLYVLIKLFVIFTLSYFTSAILIQIPLLKRAFGETK